MIGALEPVEPEQVTLDARLAGKGTHFFPVFTALADNHQRNLKVAAEPCQRLDGLFQVLPGLHAPNGEQIGGWQVVVAEHQIGVVLGPQFVKNRIACLVYHIDAIGIGSVKPDNILFRIMADCHDPVGMCTGIFRFYIVNPPVDGRIVFR